MPMIVMPRSNLARAIAASLCFGLPSTANAFEFNVNANVELTSDYVWRGSTQTQGNATAQAGVKLGVRSGWYASAWGSSVDFGNAAGATSEFDLVVGWSGALDEQWALDVNVTRYVYPSSTLSLDWTELGAALTWRQNTWLLIGHSSNALASRASGTYVQLGRRWPLGDRFRLEGMLARYALSGYADDGYSHAALSGVWTIKAPFELRLSAHTTDAAAKRIFPDLAGTRVEAAVQASF